jgi:sugar phosphate isomerase/epimerase
VRSRYTRPPEAGAGHYCSPRGDWTWDETVDAFRAAPGCLLEPHPWCCVDTTDAVMAMLSEVPGLRLVVDVGHVTYWGGDPLELLPFAGAVQLRQARVGVAQCRVDEGTVDLAAVIARALVADDPPALCVEYFDLGQRPEYRLADPRGHAIELAAYVRPLLC